MNGSRGLEGFHGTDCIPGCVPGCKIGEISAEQMSTAVKDELDVDFQGVFPLPMGM